VSDRFAAYSERSSVRLAEIFTDLAESRFTPLTIRSTRNDGMSDDPALRRWLHSPVASRVITGLQVFCVLAAITEFCFGGPGIFVRGGIMGLIGLTIGVLKKPKADRSDAPADAA
jgi:hypothetical protein